MQVVREKTPEDKFSMILKGTFQRIDAEQTGEVTMIAKHFWGDDALLRSGHLTQHKVMCKKFGIVLTLTSADFR